MVGPVLRQPQRRSGCPGPGVNGPSMLCMTRSRSQTSLERFLKMFIYIVLFYWKTYAYLIDVVFEVVKEFLYAVFFGFTKPIKRPSEMNLALTISLSLHNTRPAPGRGGRNGAESSLRRRSARPARGPRRARQGGQGRRLLAGPRVTADCHGSRCRRGGG